MIVVVDYGMGNLGSIVNMVKKVGGKATVSAGPQDLAHADRLILPGVGSFDNGMANLRRRGYVGPLEDKVLAQGTPILGICLGMQLLSATSEEGREAGLGWIEAETVRFAFDSSQPHLRVPHMGWNSIAVRQEHPLLPDREKPRRFYFIHSYHVRCRDPSNVLATTVYGIEFTSAVVKGNIVGVQFHPEKSHRFGMDLMRQFVSGA